MKNRDTLFFVYEDDKSKGNKEHLCFSEVNNQYEIIKTEKIGINGYSKILCYEETVYFSSDNYIVIYN